MMPAMSLLPRAIANVKMVAPMLRIEAHMEASNVLLDQLQRGTLGFMIGRILEKENSSALVYEELTEKPACAVVMVGHPLLNADRLGLEDIFDKAWILPPRGSILRHRFDMMFRRAGLVVPVNVVDTTALLLITALLQQTDSLHGMPVDVAHYYASLNVISILPIELRCKMDVFGIIRQKDHLLSPGAELLLEAVRCVAGELN